MRRWSVVVMLYFGILISYIDRGNLGIAAPRTMRAERGSQREIRKFHLTRAQREIKYMKVKLGGSGGMGVM
jgi:hypothetical protein